MGHKVNPIGLRLGINRTWDSRWYASRDYAKLLHDDLKLRVILRAKLSGAGVSRVVIERPAKKPRVTIYAARPGVVIGKKGAGNATGTGTLGQNIFLITNQTASYHSLQIAAGRPLSRNVMVNGFYVWSHAIQSSNESAIGQMTAQDFANLWEEKGPMDADRRNVASISGMWKISYYHGSNFFMKEVANGWTISPIWVLQSGQPINLSTGSDKNDDSANANRPDFDKRSHPHLGGRVCLCPLQARLGYEIDRDALDNGTKRVES